MASIRRNARKPYSRPNVNDNWVHDRAPGAKQAAAPQTNGLGRGPATPASARLVVSNLHYELTPLDLSKIFGQAGTLVREPQIRYDRSGRSTGTAIITYETVDDAKKAKNLFDNKTAKGQAMNIEFAALQPRPQRAASAPSTMKLLNRIEKPSLIDRLSSQDDTAGGRAEGGVGPVRNKRGGNKPKEPRQKKKPATAEDLDRELEAFMQEPAAEAPKPAAGEDVEMA
uniref:RRM domain-containing protein n=1 Tax=Schizophyllum commune (strain H4-8 / FGSC 9210) TaxID=578458 RepID=D8QHP2_SCHCM